MGVGSKAHTLYSLESLINQSRERIPSRHVFSVKIFSTFITRMQLLANWGKIFSEGLFSYNANLRVEAGVPIQEIRNFAC